MRQKHSQAIDKLDEDIRTLRLGKLYSQWLLIYSAEQIGENTPQPQARKTFNPVSWTYKVFWRFIIIIHILALPPLKSEHDGRFYTKNSRKVQKSSNLFGGNSQSDSLMICLCIFCFIVNE